MVKTLLHNIGIAPWHEGAIPTFWSSRAPIPFIYSKMLQNLKKEVAIQDAKHRKTFRRFPMRGSPVAAPSAISRRSGSSPSTPTPAPTPFFQAGTATTNGEDQYQPQQEQEHGEKEEDDQGRKGGIDVSSPSRSSCTQHEIERGMFGRRREEHEKGMRSCATSVPSTASCAATGWALDRFMCGGAYEVHRQGR